MKVKFKNSLIIIIIAREKSFIAMNVNDLYLRKTAEVGIIYGKKTFLFPTSEYFDKYVETISEMLQEIFDHCKKKLFNFLNK